MQTPSLSILIPSTHDRQVMLDELLSELNKQIERCGAINAVEIITNIDDYEKTIGEKRNELMNLSSGAYINYFDSDDTPSHCYISEILKGIETNPDSLSLDGIIYFDNERPQLFKHSIDYDSWYEKDGIFYRPPNHLNTIRSSIAKQITFPLSNFAEDKAFSDKLRESGLIRIEHKIEPVIYYYKYVTNKPKR